MKQTLRSNRNISPGDLTNAEYEACERYRAEKRENIHVIRLKKRGGKRSWWRKRRRQQRRLRKSRRCRSQRSTPNATQEKHHSQNTIQPTATHAKAVQLLFAFEAQLTPIKQ